MRIVFMGTPDFSVPALKAIVEAGHQVTAVVTQPEKPKGRGKDVQMTPVKIQALEYGIPVYQPVKVKTPEFVEVLKKEAPDAIVVIAFGQLLSKEILDLPKYGCVNIHASLLPKYRGAAPIQWAVINGDAVTGVTTMRMDEGLDTGDMILKEEVKIRADETGGSLFDRLSEVGAKLCVRTMEAIDAGTATYTPQDNSQATHTAKIYKEMGSIDWKQGAKEIECLIRGLDPWPSAYTRLGDKMLKIWKAQVVSEESGAEPGCIVKVEKDHILVQTGKGMLAISELQLEGKKLMPVEAFLNGYEIEEGTYFKKG